MRAGAGDETDLIVQALADACSRRIEGVKGEAVCAMLGRPHNAQMRRLLADVRRGRVRHSGYKAVRSLFGALGLDVRRDFSLESTVARLTGPRAAA